MCGHPIVSDQTGLCQALGDPCLTVSVCIEIMAIGKELSVLDG